MWCVVGLVIILKKKIKKKKKTNYLTPNITLRSLNSAGFWRGGSKKLHVPCSKCLKTKAKVNLSAIFFDILSCFSYTFSQFFTIDTCYRTTSCLFSFQII